MTEQMSRILEGLADPRLSIEVGPDRLFVLRRIAPTAETGMMLNGIPVRVITDDKGASGADPVTVEFCEGRLLVSNDPPTIMGGHFHDDILRFSSVSEQEVVDALQSYYFGCAVTIQGWHLNLHRHPQWDAATLQALLARPRAISRAEWETIYKMCIAEMKGRNQQGADQYSFNDIMYAPIAPSRSDSADTLMIRYDGREVLVIRR